MLALPIFPASHPASIVGEGVLNFCVRDGNRWTHTPINTNYISLRRLPSFYIIANFQPFVKHFFQSILNGDPYRIRTDVNGVRGRCLNHLTNGPHLCYIFKRHKTSEFKWCTFRDSNPGLSGYEPDALTN